MENEEVIFIEERKVAPRPLVTFLKKISTGFKPSAMIFPVICIFLLNAIPIQSESLFFWSPLASLVELLSSYVSLSEFIYDYFNIEFFSDFYVYMTLYFVLLFMLNYPLYRLSKEIILRFEKLKFNHPVLLSNLLLFSILLIISYYLY